MYCHQILFLRDSASKDNIKNDVSLVDDLIQHANSMALEAHIMAHDSGVTATELFTHPHMLRRRSLLEAPTVNLPQRDKDRLLVMEVGGNDLFGPSARQVHEWKLDTEEENVKLIARVFDERTQRDKPKKKPTSSESCPPGSMDHRSPLAGLSKPKPKDSYSQKPGQSFRRQLKQSPYKARMGNQQRSQPFNRDRPNSSSSSSNRNESRDQGQRRQDKAPKGPPSARPFNRKGRGAEAVKAVNRNNQLPVGGKLAHFTDTGTQLFPQHQEIVRKVSHGILIAFDDVPPSLLRYPLEIPSNNKAADLQSAVQKLRLSRAIEEVMDPTSPGYYSRLFLVPKPTVSTRSNNRLKEVESIHCRSFLQNGNSLLNNSSTSTTRMDNEDRLEGCVPSHPGTCQHQKILPVCHSRNSISIRGPPIWTFNSTCSSSITFSRNPDTCIPGRLDNSCYVQGTKSEPYSACSTTSPITGLDNQLGQINVTTIPNSGLSGITLQFRTSPNITSGLILTYSHRSPLPSISVNGHVCSQGLIHHQPDVSLCPIYNQRTSSSPFPPTLVQSSVDIVNHGTLQSIWIRISSLTSAGFYIHQWWPGFSYVFRSPVSSSSRMLPSKVGEPVGRTNRSPEFGLNQIPNVTSIG